MKGNRGPAFLASSWLGGGVINKRASCEVPKSTRQKSDGVGVRQVVRCARVLVVNCPSGGHAFLGAHLSKLLLADGHDVRLMHSGESIPVGVAELYDELSKQDKFSLDAGAIPSSLAKNYDVVYDNYSKSAEDCALALQQGAAGAEVHYVSSAGAYKTPAMIAPSLVGDAAKGATIDVEGVLAGTKGGNFRPIYIYGPGTAKRAYLDFFFDRIVRKRTVYIPGCGSELTSLTDVRDVVSMMYAAMGSVYSNGGRKVYNAVSPRGITFDGIAQFVGEVVGEDITIKHFDPTWAEATFSEFKLKKFWPFRVKHFFADPSYAMSDLGWSPTYSGSVDGLRSGIAAAYEEYKQLGLHKKDLTFPIDDVIAAQM